MFPREQCETDRERQLWDRCEQLRLEKAWLQAHLARINAVFFGDLQQRIAAMAEELRAKYFSAPVDYQPDTELTRAAKARDMAHARCYRANLTDEGRRKTIAQARALGGLPAEFDETALPWQEQPSTRPKAAPIDASAPRPKSKPVGQDPMRVRYLIEAANTIPEPGTPAYDLLVTGRLARLSGHWNHYKNALLATWRVVRRADDQLPGPQATYSDGARASDGSRVLYRSRGSTHQAIAWDSGVTHYPAPDQRLAVQPEFWHYPDGSVARDGPRFYAPGRPMTWVLDLGNSRTSRRFISEAAARAEKKGLAAADAWNSLPKELQALAALEIDVGRPRGR